VPSNPKHFLYKHHEKKAKSAINFHSLASSFMAPNISINTDPVVSAPLSNPEDSSKQNPSLIVFSGGTAFNTVAGQLRNFTSRVCYVLPVSDDGGSTAEIVRVLGGPAIGDIRSRCIRLADESDEESCALKRLLRHRLSSTSLDTAKWEWIQIVEGDHALWTGVSEAYKHVLRAFLIHFHEQILRRSMEHFNYRNGSVGNFFFAGARDFFRSLEAAIFLFSRVARIEEGIQVLPCIRSEDRITLAAELADGNLIRGQHNISHPLPNGEDWRCGGDSCEDKSGLDSPLDQPIRRLLYLGLSGTCNVELSMSANPAVLSELIRTDAVVYGMGSLYTSLCPTLCLNGVGEAIAALDQRKVPKILCLNGSIDRETSRALGHDGPMTAVDFVWAITYALNRRYSGVGVEGNRRELNHPPRAYVNGLLIPKGGAIEVDRDQLKKLGVGIVVEVDSDRNEGDNQTIFKAADLVDQLERICSLIRGLKHEGEGGRIWHGEEDSLRQEREGDEKGLEEDTVRRTAVKMGSDDGEAVKNRNRGSNPAEGGWENERDEEGRELHKDLKESKNGRKGREILPLPITHLSGNAPLHDHVLNITADIPLQCTSR